MSTTSAQLLVYVSGHLACIKVVGRADFTLSIDFKTLVDELSRKEFTCYILDLSQCTLMDSTFLGVLAGMGLKMSAAKNGQTNGNGNGNGIELLNPNARVAESLESLGVLPLFKVTQSSDRLPAELTPQPTGPAPTPTREEVTRNCLEAHELLMEIDPSNIARFKEVTKFLAEDLKKLKPGG